MGACEKPLALRLKKASGLYAHAVWSLTRASQTRAAVMIAIE